MIFKDTNKMDNLYVTKTFLPPIEDFVEKLEKIWDSHLVTNDGPYYNEFEQELKKHTQIDHLVALGNGTIALQIAIRALNLKGKIITTPFTHIATSDSIVWENCEPVYVDIDPGSLNIDPSKIEEKVTSDTVAIMAVHVYSNPCEIGKLEIIAKKHNLKIIYDAAHAFGAMYKDKSVLSYGDISMTSFNATKAIHTIEGGALFMQNPEMVTEVRKLAYFGMDTKKNIVQTYGTNAKLTEINAIMGILNLKYFNEATAGRKELYNRYKSLLQVNNKITFQQLSDEINYSYMPIILETKEYKDKLIEGLSKLSIYPREYFYPSLETVFKDRIECEISYDISNRVLCLPMSNYLTEKQVDFICDSINKI